MNIKVTKSFQNTKLELEIPATSCKDALFLASIFTVKDKCTLCGSTDISLEGNLDDENNQYVKRRCNNTECGAASNLGSYRAGGYFWKRFEIYAKNDRVID